MLLVKLICFLGGKLAVNVGSGFSSDLVTLPGDQLAAIEIDLPILGDETDHLMISGRNGFHAKQPCGPYDGIEGRQVFHYLKLDVEDDRFGLD